jgi:anti-sigma regulatory factor (Ser/Thr protein kinase)
VDDCVELESDPTMVLAARQFVRDRLTAWEATEHLDDAVLVASELVTNAILHARTQLTLRVEVLDTPPPGSSRVRVEVFDQNPRLPSLSPTVPEATSGRGLSLVSVLASGWGMENRGEGKVVWAEVGGESPAAETPDDCVDLTGAATVDEAMRVIEAADPDVGGGAEASSGSGPGSRSDIASASEGCDRPEPAS